MPARRTPRPAVGLEAELEALGLTVQEAIGRGSQATVLLARQERLDREVAVKVLDIEVADAATSRRFERECSAMGRLTGHPHVVTVLDAMVTPSRRAVIVMDYLVGGSLEARLRAHGPLPVADALRWGAQAADGLRAAHEVGLLHRDLKPANMLLSRYGSCAIADFGISLELEHRRSLAATATAATLTPLHAAPEVLDGAVGSVTSDVYGLCSSLWELLTGAPPYPVAAGEGIVQFVYRVMAGVLPPFGRDDAPPRLVALLQAGLAASPAARPPSADVLYQELRALEGGAAAPVGPVAVPVPAALAGPPPVEVPVTRAASPEAFDAAATHLQPGRQAVAPQEEQRARSGSRVAVAVAAVAVVLGGVLAGVVLLSRGGGHAADPAPGPSAAATPGPRPKVTLVPLSNTAFTVSWIPGTPGATTLVGLLLPQSATLSGAQPATGLTSLPFTLPAGTTVSTPLCIDVVEVSASGGPPAIGGACAAGASQPSLAAAPTP